MARTIAAAATGGEALCPALAADTTADGSRVWRYIMGADGPPGWGFEKAYRVPAEEREFRSARAFIRAGWTLLTAHRARLEYGSSREDSPRSWQRLPLPIELPSLTPNWVGAGTGR